MRHKSGYRKLNRTASHRKAMFSNMTASLIAHEQITTTLPKAKELRRFADRMISLGKKGALHHRRQAFAFLRDDADPTSLGREPRSLVGSDRSCDRDDARRRAEVPGDSAQQRRLSGAAGTQDGDELSLLDLHRDIPHDDGFAVSDRDVFDEQLRHCRRRCHRTPPT